MRVHHLAMRTHDRPRLERFYVGILGFAVRPSPRAGSTWLNAGDVVIMLEEASSDEPGIAPGTMDLLAFAVTATEKDELRGRLVAAGIAVEEETKFTVYFRDPDGRRIGASTYDFGVR